MMIFLLLDVLNDLLWREGELMKSRRNQEETFGRHLMRGQETRAQRGVDFEFVEQ